ncbi:hypothetical protein GCM10023201_41300 [Actinomycetospora corticicola]|uniref:Exonuclease domain-containing protein n=1 Tax=Actinomycetospora corticicola TaxID=663602 RepID=A0A7Y9DWF5_9PSEU|nr:hypothetical protein [Actinomycetospora corticicola]NYD36783.1 hypothetical protein [Actinomycetospora corticicola]
MTDVHELAPLAFIDTETDGVHPDRAVWEIAIVRREPDGSEEAWETFVDVELDTANPFGLKVGRFYERHPLGRRLSGRDPLVPSTRDDTLSVYTAAHHVARLTHGAHLVGAVPNFDAEVLDRDLRNQGLIGAWHYHLVDIENLAVGYLAGQGRPLPPPWDSDEITAMLDLEPTPQDERHTAMGDVRWAMRVYDRVMGRTS